MQFKNFAATRDVKRQTFEHSAELKMEADVEQDDAFDAMCRGSDIAIVYCIFVCNFHNVCTCKIQLPPREKLLEEHNKHSGSTVHNLHKPKPQTKKEKTWTQLGKEAYQLINRTGRNKLYRNVYIYIDRGICRGLYIIPQANNKANSELTEYEGFAKALSEAKTCYD